jgi:2',3'-cyclic-nucleotide 2'-phosphodiesterase/3'-nucleotidase
MRRLRLPVTALLLALLPVTAHGAERVSRVTILYTADLHGRLIGFDVLEDRAASGGLARIATLVRRIRAEAAAGPFDEVLLLDAGDAMQGDALGAAWRLDGAATTPEPMMAAMRALGYDAMAVGNHEFDFGLDAMARARDAGGFPWLAANIAADGGGAPPFAPSLVRVVNDVRVGVVGLAPPAVAAWSDSSLWRGMRFEDPVDAARREVRRLREAGHCDLVVLLAHGGLEKTASGAPRSGQRDGENFGERLANDVPGVDLVILGHTHERIDSLSIAGVPVTQPGRSGEVLGRADFTMHGGTNGADVASLRLQLLAVDDTVAADPAIAALAAPYETEARRALGVTVARAAQPVGAPAGRLADGPMWELLHRMQLAASGADVSLTALFGPDLVLEGPVTLRDLMRAYPYENRLVMLELTGGQIRAALEHAARYFRTYGFAAESALVDSAFAGHHFDTAEGLSYEIDLTRPAGDRVVRLSLGGAPLEDAQRLRVVMNDYRAGGGGGFAMFEGAKVLWRSARTARELLIDHVRTLHSLDGAHTVNWRLLPDYVPAPERPLIDRLVRLGKAPAAEVLRLGAAEPARRGDLAYWLARAFDWRSERRSGAFLDLPGQLEPWVDGLLERRVLGESARLDRFAPFEPSSVWLALDWCENAARAAGYRLTPGDEDRSFSRGLLTGTGIRPAAEGGAAKTPFTRAQLLAVISNTRFPELRVMSTSDFHGNVFPGTERRTEREWGGTLALAALVDVLRAANPEGSVLLDGGDCFQGTMISNLQFGRPVVEQMNGLEYTAMAIGNHEFDWGMDSLRARVAEMRFAALGANLLEKKSGRMPRWVRGDTLVVRRGVGVGIVGLCYRHTPTVTLAEHVAPYRFDGDSAAAARIVPRLRSKDRAEVVVAVGHVPAETGRGRRTRGGDLVRLARGIPGVDAWFGGHSHNFIEDDLGGIPLLIPGAFGRAVAVCDMVVDPVADRVVERRYRLELAYVDERPADSAWVARVERWNAGIGPIAGTPLGFSARRLDRSGPETTIGNLITDAMRAASGVDIALQNSGGMRADLDSGLVTRGDVYAVMPFDNTIVIEELTGPEVKRSLDEALVRGRVTQVSGIRYVFDLDRPPLERVLEVTDERGVPLDESRYYRVACNIFMATGGDDYATLARGRNLTDTNQPIRDAIEAYVRKASANGAALDVRRDGRIRRVEAGVPAEAGR